MGLKQCLGGKSAQGANQSWPDSPNLTLQKRKAGRDFLWFGVPVPWGTALDDIADINVLPAQVNCPQDFGKQLTGLTHKRQPTQVFLITWPLTYQDQSSLRVSRTKNNMLPPFVEPTPAAVTEIITDHLKRLGRLASVPLR
jgi:hypothetical protein